MVPSCTRSFLSTKKGRIPVKIIAQRINIVRWGKREIDLKNVEKKKIFMLSQRTKHMQHVYAKHVHGSHP